jgi:hypothetical protein
MACVTLSANNFAVIHRFSKAALEQAERNEIEKANASIGHIQVRPVKDTRSNVCGRTKQQFGVYSKRRKTREIMADLLPSIVYNLMLYSTLEPGFLKEQLNSFPALQRAVAKLPEPKVPRSKPTTKNGSRQRTF